jgi:hypothetical protein
MHTKHKKNTFKHTGAQTNMKMLANKCMNNHKNANTRVNANICSTIIQQHIYIRAVAHSERSRRVHLCTKKQAHSPPSQTSRYMPR